MKDVVLDTETTGLSVKDGQKVSAGDVIARLPKETTKTKIGCILPLSGEAAASGQKILQGIQLAFNLLPWQEYCRYW